MRSEPFANLRRLRRTPALRAMACETHLTPEQLILPLFVGGGPTRRTPLAALPGVDLLCGDEIARVAQEAWEAGLKSVLLFGVLEADRKDPQASSATEPANPVCQAIERIRQQQPGLVVIADLCLCEYTSHGHCGILQGTRIDNSQTLEVLAAAAVDLARAGADMIAPSGVMDGTVRTLRHALDAAGFGDVALMPYGAKFASGFYGPFKEASQSAPAESLHCTHQIAVGNQREALRKIWVDVDEGADFVIVKPALTALDILALARERNCPVPLVGYDVSGFYRPLVETYGMGTPRCDALMLELLTSMCRAGAQLIITYHARQVARLLR